MDIMLHMTALDTATRTWIQNEARRTGTSVETVIERLILRGVVAERQSSRAQRFHDLDDLAGTWSVEDAEEFRVATADFSQIDPALWR